MANASRTSAANGRPIMTDAEVAELLGVSVRTFQRRVMKPVTGEVDMNAAEPHTFGGRRYWVRDHVERVVGIRQK